MTHSLARTTSSLPARRDVGVSYLLFAACLVGLSGLHRFYLGRWVSGLLWLFTWGLFGIGNLVDLFLLPRMVEDHNQGRAGW